MDGLRRCEPVSLRVRLREKNDSERASKAHTRTALDT